MDGGSLGQQPGTQAAAPTSTLLVDNVLVLGVPGAAGDEAHVTMYGGAPAPRAVTYDAAAGVLRINGLAADAGKSLSFDWRLRRPGARV